jgi:hypothetical protein
MTSQTDLDLRVTDFELGWLIGILEGEGTFIYSPKQTHRVTVSMGDEDTIDRVIDIMSRLINAYVAKGQIEPRRIEYSVMYTANISGERARTLMRHVVKHMSYRRRARIWQALNKYIRRPNLSLAELIEFIPKDVA